MTSSLIELDEDLLVPVAGLYARCLSGKSAVLQQFKLLMQMESAIV